KFIQRSIHIGSLVIEDNLKSRLIENFQSIVTCDGVIETPNRIAEEETDAIERLNVGTEIQKLSDIDDQFRRAFEEEDQSIYTLASHTNSELQEIYFFSPISGIVSSPYNLKGGHFGVDIVSKKNEPIKCVADGTVIMSDWTQE